jgi:hypothetical protein
MHTGQLTDQLQVAESAREALESVPEESWTLLRGDSESANIDGINCAHRFHATIGPTGIEGVDALYQILSAVLPSGNARISCASHHAYCAGNMNLCVL